MTTLAGTLGFLAQVEVARVLALTPEGAVCAEALSDSAGRWRLECPSKPETVLAYTFQDGIVAAEAPAENGITLVMPASHACDVTCGGADAHAQFALDPVRLDGLPTERIPAMRARADRSVRLHITEFPCASTPRTLSLQAGKYRVSGGSIALQLGAPPGTRLSAVTVGGEEVEPDGMGFFELDIDGPAEISLRFTASDTP